MAASPPDSIFERAAFVVLFANLVAVRIPQIFLEGRFWAEEGTAFFVSAVTRSFWSALFFVHGGYLNLAANVAGIAASKLPLAWAPYGGSVCALLFQCIPAILIVTTRQPELQSRFALVAALLLIATPVMAEEVWIVSIASQSHLLLAAGIILALEIPRGRVALAFFACVLAFAALSSPGAATLAPLFILRAILDRSTGRAFFAAILCMGLAIQLTLYEPIADRHVGIAPSLLGAAVLTKHILLPLLGPVFSEAPVRTLALRFSEAGGPIWPLIVTGLGAVAMLAACIAYRRALTFWLLFAACTIAVGSYSGVLGDKVGLIDVMTHARYAFAPQVLCLLAALSAAITWSGWPRIVLGAVLCWIGAIGALYFFSPPALFTAGPSWTAQAAAFADKHDGPLVFAIWPPGWFLEIPAAAARR